MSLYVRETGPTDAPTVVFLHGAGVSSWMWLPQLEGLTEYHCLALNLLEHGQSVEISPLSRADAAARVADLIRTRAHGGRAHLVGLSFGAQVAIEILLQTPDLINRTVTSGTLVRPMPGLSLVKPLIHLGMPFAKLDWMIRASAKQAAIPDKYLPEFRQEARQATAERLVRAVQVGTSLRVTAQFKQIHAPLLVVIGEKEPGILRAEARDLVAAISHSAGGGSAGAGPHKESAGP